MHLRSLVKIMLEVLGATPTPAEVGSSSVEPVLNIADSLITNLEFRFSRTIPLAVLQYLDSSFDLTRY